jgi:hypothetical protein
MEFDTKELERLEAKAALDLQAHRIAEKTWRETSEAEASERSRLRALGYGSPFPLGSRVIKTSWGRKSKSIKGVVECMTNENRRTYAENGGSGHGGVFVVRHLKADGTPGIAFTSLDRWELGNWSLVKSEVSA